jgi:tetraprenyl-beta-curcumene synthase
MLEGAGGLAATFASYRLTVIPPLRRELRRWDELVRRIPDPVLRELALSALLDKASNVEAIGVFATLAPRRQRGRAIRAMAALQVAIDYIDTISEAAGEGDAPGPAEALADGLRLHRTLAVALAPGAPPEDWYALHPRHEDGGYLSALVAACQDSVQALPSAEAIAPLARRAAERCGQGQSRTHAAAAEARRMGGGVPGTTAALESWATDLEAPAGYRWWEVAAGASSSVAAHALIAAAADPAASAEQGERIDAAYFPPIGALTVLLDDLVDRDEDVAAGEHNYMSYYSSGEDAANRLALIAARGSAAASKLRRRRRHEAILAGVVAFYLSAPGARASFAQPVRERLPGSLGPATRALAAILGLRRR